MDVELKYAGSSPDNMFISHTEDVRLAARLPYTLTFSNKGISPMYDLGRVQYITITSHVDVVPVRKAVRIAVAGFTNSTGTVAGTIMYPIAPIYAFANMAQDIYNATGHMIEFIAELPPLDIVILHTSQQGQVSVEYLEGVKFPDSGIQVSSEGLEGVERYTFVARRYVPKYLQASMLGQHTESAPVTASKLITARQEQLATPPPRSSRTSHNIRVAARLNAKPETPGTQPLDASGNEAPV